MSFSRSLWIRKCFCTLIAAILIVEYSSAYTVSSLENISVEPHLKHRVPADGLSGTVHPSTDDGINNINVSQLETADTIPLKQQVNSIITENDSPKVSQGRAYNSIFPQQGNPKSLKPQRTRRSWLADNEQNHITNAHDASELIFKVNSAKPQQFDDRNFENLINEYSSFPLFPGGQRNKIKFLPLTYITKADRKEVNDEPDSLSSMLPRDRINDVEPADHIWSLGDNLPLPDGRFQYKIYPRETMQEQEFETDYASLPFSKKDAKRSRFDVLIEKLGQLAGHKQSNGRAMPMRFGPGRR